MSTKHNNRPIYEEKHEEKSICGKLMNKNVIWPDDSRNHGWYIATSCVREIGHKEHCSDAPVCEECSGFGWLWWWQLKKYTGPAGDPHDCYSDETKYPCQRCKANKYD